MRRSLSLSGRRSPLKNNAFHSLTSPTLFPHPLRSNSDTQSNIKRDPEGYVEEFEMQVKKNRFFISKPIE